MIPSSHSRGLIIMRTVCFLVVEHVKNEAKELLVLRVRPTLARFPTNILSTLLCQVCDAWEARCGGLTRRVVYKASAIRYTEDGAMTHGLECGYYVVWFLLSTISACILCSGIEGDFSLGSKKTCSKTNSPHLQNVNGKHATTWKKPIEIEH